MLSIIENKPEVVGNSILECLELGLDDGADLTGDSRRGGDASALEVTFEIGGVGFRPNKE